MYAPVRTRDAAGVRQTGRVSIREAIGHRWRACAAWLRVQAPGQPRPSAWAWTADVILAVLLAAAAVNGAAGPPHRDGDAGIRVELHNEWAVPVSPIAPLAPNRVSPHGVNPYGARPYDDPGPGPGSAQLALAALTALPLATRRRYPLASFWVIALCAFRVYHFAADPTWTVVASVIAAYSAPTYSKYRNLALASVVVGALLTIGFSHDNLPGLPSGVVTFLLLSSVGLAANAIHTWRLRARTLEREQAAATRLAVDRERARLARELHDVVTHNVSVMVVQAGAARKVMDTAPELAREALLAVEAGGRAAMTELRQAIGLLSGDLAGDPDFADLAPQPDLDRLPDLVARVRQTGVPVTLSLIPGPPVPPGIGLAAYRVVQEALTNAVKHAAGAAVHVGVDRSDSVLRVEVTDTGGDPAAAPGSGRGLIGLRERLALYGGTLTAGPRPTGGFRVVAEIPLEPAAAGVEEAG